MQKCHDEIRGLGAEVLVVTFSPPERIPRYVESHASPFPVVADPKFEAYGVFDLPRASWWQIAGPKAIGDYLKLMVRGRMPAKHTKGDDLQQLGGDFILNAQGRLVYLYRSQQSTDRPSVEALLNALRKASER